MTNPAMNLRENANLYALLLAPIGRKLADFDALVIVPDAILWNVPFKALRVPRGRHLIEDYTITYAPSLTALLEMKKRTTNQFQVSNFLGLADPVIGDAQHSTVEKIRGEKLGPLPSAVDEVNSISKLIGTNKSLVINGAAATEARFRALAADSNILHFETHSPESDDPAN